MRRILLVYGGLMAKRTEEHKDLTLFKNRLIALMEEKGEQYNSGRKLALALYEGRYFDNIDYNTNDGNNERKRNDIWRIEKQIEKHMNLETCDKVNGKYLIIYSSFFGCSTDYLLGITKVKSNNPKIREICEYTGLSEKAVVNLTYTLDEELSGVPLQYINEVWNVILESDLFDIIRWDWFSLCNQIGKSDNEMAEIEAWDKIKNDSKSDLMLFHEAKIETLKKNIGYYEDFFYGRLNKISREISMQLEASVKERYSSNQQHKKTVEEKIKMLKSLFANG